VDYSTNFVCMEVSVCVAIHWNDVASAEEERQGGRATSRQGSGGRLVVEGWVCMIGRCRIKLGEVW
jgi:hypothetical protein